MKINNQDVVIPEDIILVIPKGKVHYVFKAKTVLDETDFKTICPEINPPTITRPGQSPTPNLKDAEFIKAREEWAEKKTNWLILKSLEATDGLEWDTVDMADPETWDNYRQDLEKAHFSNLEVLRIIGITIEANGLDQGKIDEALESFLVTQAEALKST